MLAVKPVLLWSDALFFALIAASIGGLWWARGQDHLRQAWRRVTANPVGMAAATVLTLFVLVAVLDSLHYRPRLAGAENNYSIEVFSAFYALLLPLKTNTDKTYSAPLATHRNRL